MLRSIIGLSAIFLATACAEPAASTATPSSPAAEAVPAGSAAPGGMASAGERAPFVIDGDVVKVNNRICAVSRSPMGEETLGQFVSRVRYDGPDARFQGKTLEFNQCCPMCLDRFPQEWAERREEIMRFHGLSAAG